MLLHVAGEHRAKHEGVRAEPDQLSFHFPAMLVGAPEERLHARVLGNFGKGIGQEGADGIGDAMEILVRRRDGQIVDERRIQNPEEVTESVAD